MTSRKLFSLVFVRKSTQVLLGLKKRGFGMGKWNGFGGKVEPGETLLQGAIRELQEECGLKGSHLKKIGLLEFEFQGNPTLLEVHVFETYKFEGTVTESEEMKPQWFDIANIPFDDMWPDDTIWFPYMFKEVPFKGYFLYKGLDTILKHKIDILDYEQLLSCGKK